MTSRELISRRNFLKRATGFTLGYSAFNQLYDLRLIQSALAQSAGGGIFPDYKALVCLFLSGGNDSGNLLIPNDATEYATYAATRGSVTLGNTPGAPGSNTIIPLSNVNTGRQFGVHCSAPELQGMFDAGTAAFVANTGTLVEPLTKATFRSGAGKRPPQLFSHNDQVVQWQTSIPDKISPTGWGGRCTDLLRDYVGTSAISMSISAAGFNTWEAGKYVNQYQVNSAGTGTPPASGVAITPSGFTTFAARQTAIRNIIAQGQGSSSLMEADYARVFDTALDAADLLNTAIGSISAADHTIINNAFDGTVAAPGPLRSPNGTPDIGEVRSLAGQMKTIARMIAARSAIGIKRQIFFCQIGGWDTHGSQLAAHNNLVRAISRNIKAFQDCMTGMGIGDKATIFTASDFARTYKSNGSGTDHAWGTHAVVAGGAVQGGRVYGTFPTVTPGGPDDVDNTNGQGRWIPTTSVDEYSATLAKWFGVNDANLDVIFPNLHRFAHRDVGFLAAV